MTRILIPRSDSVSAKVIEPSDFEELHSYVPDHVKSGFTVAAGSGLQVTIASGKIRLKGLYLNNTATETLTVTASNTNHIYAVLARDSNSEAESWSITSNTTGSAPTDSIKIATCVASGSAVTSVDQTFLDTKREPAYVPTGAILMWSGTITDIPTGWLLCDGNSGTPNLVGKFIRGVNTSSTNPGGSGGADSRTLTIPRMEVWYDVEASSAQSSHGSAGGSTAPHPSSGHSQIASGQTSSSSSFSANARQGSISSAVGYHPGSNSYTYHSADVQLKTDETNITSIENRPAYYELAYIIKT
jgi:hypothetical protein